MRSRLRIFFLKKFQTFESHLTMQRILLRKYCTQNCTMKCIAAVASAKHFHTAAAEYEKTNQRNL